MTCRVWASVQDCEQKARGPGASGPEGLGSSPGRSVEGNFEAHPDVGPEARTLRLAKASQQKCWRSCRSEADESIGESGRSAASKNRSGHFTVGPGHHVEGGAPVVNSRDVAVALRAWAATEADAAVDG